MTFSCGNLCRVNKPGTGFGHSQGNHFIRKFVKFFDNVELISNTGWLVLNEEYLKNFCKVQHGWILNYEKEMTKDPYRPRLFPFAFF
jgi:hypothetical protein